MRSVGVGVGENGIQGSRNEERRTLNALNLHATALDFLEHHADALFIEFKVVNEIDVAEELLLGDIIFLKLLFYYMPVPSIFQGSV